MSSPDKALVIIASITLIVIGFMIRIGFLYNHKFIAKGYHSEAIIVSSDDIYYPGDKVYYRSLDFGTNEICSRSKYSMSDSCIIQSKVH